LTATHGKLPQYQNAQSDAPNLNFADGVAITLKSEETQRENNSTKSADAIKFSTFPINAYPQFQLVPTNNYE
jgi:hypothetical protein